MTGDYVTLHVNGVRYLEKAPLPYWLVAASYHLFGVNEFATRLPMALSVMLLGILAAVWSRRAFDDASRSLRGSFCLHRRRSISVHPNSNSRRTAQPVDRGKPLFLADRSGSHRKRLAIGTRDTRAWRLGVLVKGLIAIAFPAAAAFIYLALTGDWRRWRQFRIFSGLALFLVIAAPWHILAGLRNTGGQSGHGFFWFYFVNEHFLRFLRQALSARLQQASLGTVLVAPSGLVVPLEFYLPSMIRTAIETRKDQPIDFTGRTRLLCWVLAGVVLVFFAISTNQEYYTFPAYLPLLMLLAEGIARCERRDDGTGGRMATRFVLVDCCRWSGRRASLYSLLWKSRIASIRT